jgi:3',5'-cyclic AMP phosphodiesterase CpdA
MNKAKNMTRRDALKSIAGIAAGSLIRPVSIFAADPAQDKIRFAILGDWGTDDDDTIGIARQMFTHHRRTPFDLVLTAGDNIYPDGDGRRFRTHFERPFASLLADRVNFYAVLGNHDVERGRTDQLQYPLFNMNGKRYYSIKQGGGLAEFFMLDSTDFDGQQTAWLQQALRASTSRWKVVVLHHPLYSSGSKHGSNAKIRMQIEPMLVTHGVNAVFAGHDHIYERTKPQRNIQHFVTGAGGKTRRGGVELDSPIRQVSFDEDNHFMLLEADEREIRFQAISETGRVIDRGIIHPLPL